MKRASIPAVLLALAALLLAAQTALAHSFIDHCSPDVGATLQQAPAQIACVFTEAVDAKQTKFTVTDANNNRVDNNDVKADPNDTKSLTLVFTLNTAKITSGQYTVKWTTMQAGGDQTDGQWQFSVNAQPVPTIVLVTPTMVTPFDKDPSDVPVSIKVANFALGQGGRRWQIYLDGKLVTQVTDGSTSTILKAVKAGDYAMKVALATDDTTIVATAGTHLGVALAAPMTMPAGNAPATMPKTGADTAGWPLQVIALALVLLALLAMGLGRSLRRTP